MEAREPRSAPAGRLARLRLAVAGVAWIAGAAGCTNETAAPATPTVHYAAVQTILEQSCAKQVCHGFMVMNARLDLTADPRAVLVDVPACEYDRMMRVAPFDPEHSWIMIKLAGPVRFRQFADFIDFTPAADWEPSASPCASRFEDGSPWFGTPMPPPDTTIITPAEIETIATWIREGARAD